MGLIAVLISLVNLLGIHKKNGGLNNGIIFIFVRCCLLDGMFISCLYYAVDRPSPLCCGNDVEHCISRLSNSRRIINGVGSMKENLILFGMFFLSLGIAITCINLLVMYGVLPNGR